MTINKADEVNSNKSEATKSFMMFAVEMDQSEMLLNYMNIGNSFIIENITEAKQRLIGMYNESDIKVDFKKNDPEKFLNINFYNNHFSRMMYVRIIDNLNTYFKDILAEIVIKKPQILKSKETEKLDFILEHETMEDLLKSISEKKIEELFYKGLKDIKNFFYERLGVEIFEDVEQEKAINLLIKQRNLIVHNRGKITKDFTKEFPIEDFVEGKQLDLKYNYVAKLNLALYSIIAKLDIKLSEKFKLDLISY